MEEEPNDDYVEPPTPRKPKSRKGKKKKIYIVEESSESEEETPQTSINSKVDEIKKLLLKQKFNN